PLVEAAEAAGRPVAGLCLDDFGHDALSLGDAALRAASGLLKTISRQGRTRLPASQLALGLECGRSDPSSGLVANPLVGHMADAVTDAGGTAIFAETTEWLGAEALLTARAASPEIAAAIRNAALRREQRAIAEGMDLTYNNPSLTNIQAGLTTIEEKSLGAIAKSGSRTIEGVLAYGETPPAAGLWAMDAAAYAPESLTGFTAAGCNLALFTTGVGNSYTSALMPTVKLTANPETARRITAQLDFTAEAVFSGDEPMERAARRLIDQIAATASGELTFGEILSDCDEVIGRYGAAL
ncbi:MAG: UxaA family hydrolase, partial [Geminicoccaceae bacterium]|nr:UxaA family hydrolase [Geminicoccaceae bacterium]